MRHGKMIVIRCDYSPPFQPGSLSDYYKGGAYDQGKLALAEQIYCSGALGQGRALVARLAGTWFADA